MAYSSFLRTFVAISFLVQINALCYFPDGKTIPRQDTPCLSEGESTCCGQGYACMSNGLCKLTEYVSDRAHDQSTYVRGSCSDSTWSSSGCPNVCLTPSNGDNPHGGMGLEKCDNFPNRYYCINNVTFPPIASALPLLSICASSTYYVDFTGTATTVTIIGVAASTSVTTSSPSSLMESTSAISTPGPSVQVATPTSSQISPPASSFAVVSPSKDKNYTVPIAVGVAVPLGVIAASIAAYLLWQSRRSKSQVGHATAPKHDLPVSEHKPHLPPYGVSSMHPSPINRPALYQEQPHWAAPTELPVDHGYGAHK